MDFMGALNAIADLFLARTRGSREQAGRQDREARAQVVAILHAWEKRLRQEENRRAAIQRREPIIVTPDGTLEMIDNVQFAWQVLDALNNPLLNRRAAARVERDMRGLIGDDFVDHLKKRSKEPHRPRSWNDMHEWAREMITHGLGRSSTSRAPTPVEDTVDLREDVGRVARVRQQLERTIVELLR